jgi:aminopeptidase N
VRPGLELVAAIQPTGDIFFPLGLLPAMLDVHVSDAVARTVRQVLDERPDYPPRLHGEILQAAHKRFRAADIIAAGR